MHAYASSSTISSYSAQEAELTRLDTVFSQTDYAEIGLKTGFDDNFFLIHCWFLDQE